MDDKDVLTTSAGAPIADNQNAMTAGPRGPVLLQDYRLTSDRGLPIGVRHMNGYGSHTFNLFDKGQKARLFSNIAEAMSGVPDFIIERQLGLFQKVSAEYADGVRTNLREMLSRAQSATAGL